MQDGWCGEDTPLPGSRPTGWEEEEDVEIGMWNSSSSQELNSSLNWPPYTKKMSSKVNISRALLLQLQISKVVYPQKINLSARLWQSVQSRQPPIQVQPLEWAATQKNRPWELPFSPLLQLRISLLLSSTSTAWGNKPHVVPAVVRMKRRANPC